MPTLAGERCGGKPGLDREQVPVVASVSVDEAATPVKYKNLPTVPTFLFCRYCLMGPKIHWR